MIISQQLSMISKRIPVMWVNGYLGPKVSPTSIAGGYDLYTHIQFEKWCIIDFLYTYGYRYPYLKNGGIYIENTAYLYRM